MSFNTQWDIDQYKTEHECDEHWTLRRSFMEAHKQKFTEERLVCLAQVFTNVEFLGCRYPAETMQLIAELSSGVADSYREKQKGKLQRTFVKASDAAGAKVKGLKRPGSEAGEQQTNSDTKTPKTIESLLNPAQQQTKVQVNKNLSNQQMFVPSSKARADPACSFDPSRYGGVRTYHIDGAAKAKQPPISIKDGPYGRLILIDDGEHQNANSILQRSMNACHVSSNYEFENMGAGTINCKIFVNNKLLVDVSESGSKNSRETASRLAVEKLRETCYTLRVSLDSHRRRIEQ